MTKSIHTRAPKKKKRIKPPVQFHSRDRIGKAGERAVERFIEEKIGFIYRKLGPPDIGIDGEIEILNPEGLATGGLIKSQIKTTDKSLIGQRIRVPIEEQHLDYFDNLMVSPVLFVVSLADDRIWWKPILQKENYRGPRGGFGVSFNENADVLKQKSSEVLRMVGEQSNAMTAGSLIEEVHEQLTDIDDAEANGNFDFVTVQGWAERLAQVGRMMRDAKCLMHYERRYADKIAAIKERYREAQDRIFIRQGWFSEWNCSDVLEEAENAYS